MASNKKVALLGLGKLGTPITSALLRSGFEVNYFDDEESEHGGLTSPANASNSFAEAAKDAAAVIVATSKPEHVVNLGPATDSSIPVLAPGALVLLCSTIAPATITKLKNRLADERKDVLLLDAPISKNLDGKLVALASGKEEALSAAKAFLSAFKVDIVHVGCELATGSKLDLVNNVLIGLHLAAAAEAIALGAYSGLNLEILYKIISTAAGTSKVFTKIVPHMLNIEHVPFKTLSEVTKSLDAAIEEASIRRFPLPLTAAAYQQVLLGCAAGYEKENCASIIKIWKREGVRLSARKGVQSELKTGNDLKKVVSKRNRVAFIGLGAMGFGMATNLLKKGFTVHGYDVYEPSMRRFVEAGGLASHSPEDAAKDVDILIVMVTNEGQVENLLYGHQGAVKVLKSSSVVVVSSTVSPQFVRDLESRLNAQGRDLHVVDAPVSGGVVKAANGTLTIMASATTEAFERAASALLEMSENLYVLEGGPGVGSSVKMINQLLAGIHIAASAEAVAFGKCLGLDTRSLYDFMLNADGCSWMFVNRVPHMLDSDYTPLSALDIFVKDLGIVLSESKTYQVPLPLTSGAYQQFLTGSAAGWGRNDDAAVVKIFERMANISVAGPKKDSAPSDTKETTDLTPTQRSVSKEELLKSLPPEWPEDALGQIHRAEREGIAKVLVVLDDDATGTQTVNGVTVLTNWDVELIADELAKRPPCLFILTNSRAFGVKEAASLTKEVCQNVIVAAEAAGRVTFTIVLRGDSTLRGHFPEEADAVVSVLGETDAWIICPFFLPGGRYTINDTHYVADGDRLNPAGETEFARDTVFGYTKSDLREWVEEKTKGRVPAKDVASVSLETIRTGGPEAVRSQLCSLKKGTICIVNAASDRDIQVFAAGMIQAEAAGKSYLCRTAAQFVSARVGLEPKIPRPSDMGSLGHNGGLIVVGSYVPKTTAQMAETKAKLGAQLEWISVNASALASETSDRQTEISQVARLADCAIASGRDAVIITSRGHLAGSSVSESIKIASCIANGLVEIVKRIQTRPRYLLAKGGITSSDMATKAMEASNALVVGQALPGVPLWQLGKGSRYPDLPYIVFPGNVGGPGAVAEVMKIWSKPLRQSTNDILTAAKNGRYAIGAFNVYNLEAVQAVVAAAEAEKSPAILQIHPAALDNGGPPLVACCIAAAKTSTVPITLHLDHWTDKTHAYRVLELGFDSVMMDGSALSFQDNTDFTRDIARAAHSKKIAVEAELGRLSGTEDGLTVEEYEAHFTDCKQAEEFLSKTQVDALAVCVGNVHGKYPASGPSLNLDLLQDLHLMAEKHNVKLVLHGASGLSAELVNACIERGVTKFNVNTEMRGAYMKAVAEPHKDVVDLIRSSKQSMQCVVAEKLRLFGSSGKAQSWAA